jgi:predicted Rossmann fold flavoprotein
VEIKKIVVVGAGPAGMLAAIRASELHQKVTLIEKNPILGNKLLLSGKGRCNLTNNCELDSFLERFSKGGQFLRDSFKKFFNQDLIRFLEKRGLKVEIERQLRVFPASNSSQSVLKVLKNELQKNKVKIIYKNAMTDIFIQNNRIKGLLLKDGRVIPADKIILATGGVSYGFTGSTGEGLEIARRLGHSIVPPKAGLVPLETRQGYPRLLEGLVLKNIRLKFSDGQKQIVSEIGELLFTKFGISGPLVLSVSGQIVDWLSPVRSKALKTTTAALVRTSNGESNVYVEIDLKPALSKEQLSARILREFQAGPKKSIRNALETLLPKRLVGVFLGILRILPDKKVNQITQKERCDIISLLKGLRLNITKPRPIEEAMITRGGVSLKEINPRTMESRRIKGLYFAGEMMDVDADTGGFNLQAAFSTGYLAAESASLLN